MTNQTERKYRVDDVRITAVNSRDCKVFVIREWVDYTWRYVGRFTAPVKTPDDKLVLLARPLALSSGNFNFPKETS